MTGDPQKTVKTVSVNVPPEVEDRARKRAENSGDLEAFLLDEFLFEYEWDFDDG